MTPSTNAVAIALLAQLQTATFDLYSGPGQQFRIARRRFTKWDQTSPESMPSLMLWEPGENYQWVSNPQAKNQLRWEAIVYLEAPADQSQDPIVDIDAVKDAMFDALKPSSGMDRQLGKQTLGGLVEYCRIEGDIVKAAGDVDNISLLIVPIRAMIGAPIV